MKLLYCLMLLLCHNRTPAQEKVQSNPIAIGDKVPDITFSTMVNSKSQTVSLSQHKGKLVILDFWATWCGSCIKKFNMLDSMQRKYPGKLQVILISTTTPRDTKEKLEKFFNRQKNASGNRLILPAAYNDSLAAGYFPHTYIPHYVWINKEGECIAITGPDEVTAQNIQALMDGRQTAFAGISLMGKFDFKKPLFIDDNAGNGEGIKFRSTLSSYIPGMGSFARTSRTKNNLVTQYKMINVPLLLMLTQAYRYLDRDDRILLSVSDSIKNCIFPLTDSAHRANTYTYETITPPVPSKTLSAYIAQDLERWFGLAGKYEFRPAPCYLLTVDTFLLGRFRTAGATLNDHLNDPDSSYIINGALSGLTEYLNYRLDRFVLQQDSIAYNLDISLPPRPGNDCGPYIVSLASMGIILTPATRPVLRFIIYQLPKQ